MPNYRPLWLAICTWCRKTSAMCRRLIFVLLALLCPFAKLSAQRAVSFGEAVELLCDNHAELRGARYAMLGADYERRAARGLRLPQLRLMGAYALLQRDVAIELGGAKGVVTETLNSLIGKGLASGMLTPDVAQLLGEGLSPLTSMDWGYTLQRRSFAALGAELSVPIYAGGRIAAANRAADIELTLSRTRYDALLGELVTQLAERYFGVVLLGEVVAVRQEVVCGMQSHLRDAEAMAEEGLLAHSTVLYLEYRLSEAEAALDASQHELSLARMALCTMVGEEVTPRDMLCVDAELQELDYYVDIAEQLNPNLAAANLNLALAEEGVKLARAAYLPEVAALGAATLGSYNLSGMAPRWALGVGLRLNLFDGLASQRRHAASKMRVQEVGALVENGRDELRLLIRSQYFNIADALSSYHAALRLSEFAEEYYLSLQEGFREGVTPASELIDARLAYSASKLDALADAYDYCRALVALYVASGLTSRVVDMVTSGVVVEL